MPRRVRSAPASAQSRQGPRTRPSPAPGSGSIRGLVLDTRGPAAGRRDGVGARLDGGLRHSPGATGGSCSTRFPPAPYTVRVHLDGFAPSVAPDGGGPARRPAPSIMSVALKALAAPAVTADGRTRAGRRRDPARRASGTAADASASDSGDDYDHGETAWRLRHLKRGVLKGVDTGIVTADAGARRPKRRRARSSGAPSDRRRARPPRCSTTSR